MIINERLNQEFDSVMCDETIAVYANEYVTLGFQETGGKRDALSKVTFMFYQIYSGIVMKRLKHGPSLVSTPVIDNSHM